MAGLVFLLPAFFSVPSSPSAEHSQLMHSTHPSFLWPFTPLAELQLTAEVQQAEGSPLKESEDVMGQVEYLSPVQQFADRRSACLVPKWNHLHGILCPAETELPDHCMHVAVLAGMQQAATACSAAPAPGRPGCDDGVRCTASLVLSWGLQ